MSYLYHDKKLLDRALQLELSKKGVEVFLETIIEANKRRISSANIIVRKSLEVIIHRKRRNGQPLFTGNLDY